MATGDLIKATVNAARTLVRREYEGGCVHWVFWCPACDDHHLYNNRMGDGRAGWEWNGDMDAPTFTPSLRYLTGGRCHLFVTAGVIEFCGDCPHSMAGQKVPLPPIPEGVLRWLAPPPPSDETPTADEASATPPV